MIAIRRWQGSRKLLALLLESHSKEEEKRAKLGPPPGSDFNSYAKMYLLLQENQQVHALFITHLHAPALSCYRPEKGSYFEAVYDIISTIFSSFQVPNNN